MIRLFSAILFFMAALNLHAQPYTACFTMNKTQVCAGEAVTFTDCSGSLAGTLRPEGTTTTIQLDATVPNNSYTYNTAGVYHPFQIVNDGMAGNSISPTQTLTVVDNLTAPSFTFSNCAGNQVTVNITDTHYDSYAIAWGDGNTGTALPSGSATHTYSATGLYTVTVTGSFASASCTSIPVSNSIATLNALVTPSIYFLGVDDQQINGTIRLTVLANLPTQRYMIEQQQGSGGYVDKANATFSNMFQTYTIDGIPTSVDPFYYRIYAYDDCGARAYSDEVYSCILTATAINDQNNISWVDYHSTLTSNFSHYELLRDGIMIASNLTTNSYTDLDITNQQTYQYQVITRTAGNASAYSAVIAVTAITTSVVADKAEEVNLSPNPSAEGLFKLDNSKAEYYDEISVSNTDGKILFSLKNVSDNEIILDLSSAKPGMYIATLKSSNGMKVARLVK